MRVLVADDEAALVQLLAAFLERIGWEVETVASGDDAWRLIESAPDRFDVFLIDLAMPVVPGDELARRIQRIRPSAPIILTSGYLYDPSLLDHQGRSVDFLAKPFSPSELERMLGELVPLAADER